MKKILLIINGPAYGADETFNAIRLAARPWPARGRHGPGLPHG
jgi:sulfur relay (sulfurtransferase) complex TusBCD TusD component (DsrE family)